MSQYANVMRLDVRLQARARLYTFGIVVALFIGLIARLLLPDQGQARGLVAILFLTTGGSTLLFGASMVVLEKTQGTLLALRVSPLGIWPYLLSKVITLTAFALVESAVVYVIGGAPPHCNPLLLVAGLILLNFLYALAGLGIIASYDSMTRFLMPTGMLVSLALQLPSLGLAQVGPDTLWYAMPGQAPLLLMLAAFESLSPAQWLYIGLASLIWVPLVLFWAARRVSRHLGLGD